MCSVGQCSKKKGKKCRKCIESGTCQRHPKAERSWIIKDFCENKTFQELYSIESLLSSTEIPLSRKISYEPLKECAEKIIDLTLLLAKCFLTGTPPEQHPEYQIFKPKKSLWPTVGELNMISGLGAIEDYVNTLEFDITLKYCVNFISQIVDQLATTFIYEVKWSSPTKEEPVQLSTANMYFSLRSYFAHLPSCPIEVTYSYENSSLVFTPGEVQFKENWILNIMESKTEFREKNGFQMETFI